MLQYRAFIGIYILLDDILSRALIIIIEEKYEKNSSDT